MLKGHQREFVAALIAVGTRVGARFAAFVATLALCATSAFAQSANWINTAGGNWNVGANWSGGEVPGTAAGDAVNLNADFTLGGAKTITLDTSAIVGTMIYGDSSGSSVLNFTNSGGSTLTFDNSSTASTLVFQGANSAGFNVPILLANNLSISGNPSTFNGTISASTPGTKTITNLSAATYAGSISDGAGQVAIEKTTANLTLSGNNTFSGGVDVGRGNFTLQHANALGTGLLTLTNGGGGIVLNATDGLIFTNNILFNGGVVNNGSGSITWSGTMTVAANSTFDRAGGTAITANLYLSDTSTNGRTLTLGSTVANGSGTISGTIANYNGGVGTAGGITKAGTGTWTLSGDNTYSGGTLISAGTLGIGAGGTTGSVAGNITNNASLMLNRSDTWTVANVISGTGAVTKSGAGTLTLTASNSYTGATTVSNGTLAVNGSINSATTVQSGATLAGTGSVSSATIASGGTISPGNSPGTLTLTNGMTWDGGGNYNWQIFDVADSSKWDLIDVTGGTFTLNGISELNKFNINLWSLSGLGPDTNGAVYNFNNTQSYSWRIVSSASPISGTFSNSYFNINTGAVNGTGGFANDLGGGMFSVAMDGNNLNLVFSPGSSPIPEPGTWAAAALLAGTAGFVRWRRRRA